MKIYSEIFLFLYLIQTFVLERGQVKHELGFRS